MTKIVHGTIHGRNIEISEDLGLSEGQEVEVQVRALPASHKAGDGLLRTEGALSDDTEWDAIMEEIHRERKYDTRKEVTD